MGLTPVIDEVVGLANFKFGVRVQAATLGWTPVSYTVSVGSGDPVVWVATAGVAYSRATVGGVVLDSILRQAWLLGYAASGWIKVKAVGAGVGEEAESAAVAFVYKPAWSVSGVVRQQVADLLQAAALTVYPVGTETVDAVFVHADDFGRARTVQASKPMGEGVFPLVEVGAALSPSASPEGNWQTMVRVGIPLRVLVACRDFDEGAELAHGVMSQVRRALDGTDNLGLSWFGVIDKSWEWSGGGAAEASPDGRMVSLRCTLMVPVTGQSGDAA